MLNEDSRMGDDEQDFEHLNFELSRFDEPWIKVSVQVKRADRRGT